MRKVTVVRLGVAAALAMMGTAGALGSGCSTSSATPDGGGGGGGNADSGCTSNCTTGDATTDTGATGATGSDGGGTDAATPPPPANLVLAHTAPGIPPFRVCFLSTSTTAPATVAPFPALPDNPSSPLQPSYPTTGTYPGVAGGTGALGYRWR